MKQPQNVTTFHWPAWLNAAVLLLASVGAVAGLTFQSRPGAEVLAVAFPPWWTSQEIFAAAAAADATIVRTTAVAAILVIRPNDHEGVIRLRQAGAWFTIDPQVIAGCFKSSEKVI